MTKEITFALDYNLGLAATDPVLQAFFAKHNIDPILYKNMKTMAQELEEHKLHLAYLPAAAYFYFKKDGFYTPISNSIYSANRKTKISSLLIVSSNSSVNTLSQLRGKCMGYTHPYDTHSFFAPALLLARNNYSIHSFFSSMREIGASQIQIDSVIAGKVDATMVEEDIWFKLPKNSERTKIIARVEQMPSPVILASKELNQTLVKDLQQFLYNYKPSLTSTGLFNGFVPYEKEQMEAFFEESSQAFATNAMATSRI